VHTGPVTSQNLLGDVPPTLLPDDAAIRGELSTGAPAAEVAARHPEACLPWAVLAEEALAQGRTIEGYAFARVGYHRGLDALRRSGWRGQGPVPWSHLPNRGFLRALSALGVAAGRIGEDTEFDRVRQFLADSDPAAAALLEGGDAAELDRLGPAE
jgi:hypothetical protein